MRGRGYSYTRQQLMQSGRKRNRARQQESESERTSSQVGRRMNTASADLFHFCEELLEGA